jgi:hypothetical protein
MPPLERMAWVTFPLSASMTRSLTSARSSRSPSVSERDQTFMPMSLLTDAKCALSVIALSARSCVSWPTRRGGAVSCAAANASDGTVISARAIVRFLVFMFFVVGLPVSAGSLGGLPR